MAVEAAIPQRQHVTSPSQPGMSRRLRGMSWIEMSKGSCTLAEVDDSVD